MRRRAIDVARIGLIIDPNPLIISNQRPGGTSCPRRRGWIATRARGRSGYRSGCTFCLAADGTRRREGRRPGGGRRDARGAQQPRRSPAPWSSARASATRRRCSISAKRSGPGNGPPIDIALDPLEGTTITAKGGANALAVVAMADAGGFSQRARCLYGQNRGRRRIARRSCRYRRGAGG